MPPVTTMLDLSFTRALDPLSRGLAAALSDRLADGNAPRVGPLSRSDRSKASLSALSLRALEIQLDLLRIDAAAASHYVLLASLRALPAADRAVKEVKRLAAQVKERIAEAETASDALLEEQDGVELMLKLKFNINNGGRLVVGDIQPIYGPLNATANSNFSTSSSSASSSVNETDRSGSVAPAVPVDPASFVADQWDAATMRALRKQYHVHSRPKQPSQHVGELAVASRSQAPQSRGVRRPQNAFDV